MQVSTIPRRISARLYDDRHSKMTVDSRTVYALRGDVGRRFVDV